MSRIMHSQTSKVVWPGLPRPMFFLKNLVSRNFASWNQASQWLCKLDGLRLVAYALDDESIGLIGLARH